MTVFFILPLIPLIGGILTLINYFRQKDTKLLSNVFSGLLFVCALLAAFTYKTPLVFNINFFEGADNIIQDIKLQLEGLSLFMIVLVSSISYFVHQFASRYLSSDASQGRFMAQLSLLTAAVLFLVMGGNLLSCFLGWEFVGLTLYLLLNHYHYDQRANRAAKKEFIINRLGDAAFMVAIILCLFYFNSSEFSVLASKPVIIWSGFGRTLSLQTLIVFLIFIAIMTKSAQFPFHIWLPDTMQAPTPVSAMMHAGVINIGGFLLARLSPYIPLGSVLSGFIYTIGMISMVAAAFFGLSQHDIKRQLAYSTMGQMGYMIVQTGLGFFSAAVFHLAAHGFFKAYLFLSAGSTIGHKYESHGGSLRQGLTAIKISALTFIIFAEYNILVYHHFPTSVAIVGMFISMSLGQYMSELTMLRISNNQKVVIYLISLVFLTIYVYLINGLDDYLNLSVVNQTSNVSWYKLVIAILVMLLQVFVWVKPLFKNEISVIVTIRAYYFSVNKLFVEEFFRKFILQPYEKLSIKLNELCLYRAFKLPLGAVIFGCISVIVMLHGLFDLTGDEQNNLLILLILTLLVISLITAYRANTLGQINYYLFIAQINMASIGLCSMTRGFLRTLSLLQLLNATLIFIGIYYIQNSYQQTDHEPPKSVGNKLIWSSFYYCILMFLLVGIPFTTSFTSELYILSDVLQGSPFFVVIVALSFVFLAMAILNALQEYVFNAESILLKQNIQISRIGHVFLLACILFNIINGLAPSWLVRHIYLFGA